MKQCERCKETKPIQEFYKDVSRPDGFTYCCKICVKGINKRYASTEKGRETSHKKYAKWRKDNLELARKLSREGNKRARAENPRRFKDYEIKSAYGMPYGWLEEQLEKQGYSCAICSSKTPGGKGTFHVDHCHETNVVRGLLCHSCNVGIGQLKHSVEILDKAIQYLQVYSVTQT